MSLKYSLLLIFVTLIGVSGWSQSPMVANQTGYYPIQQSDVEPLKPELKGICDIIDSLQKEKTLRSIHVTGTSSPDGAHSLNESLAKRRAEGVTNYIINNTSAPRNILTSSYNVCTWQDVCSLLSNSLYSSSPFRNEICDAIKTGGSAGTIQRRLKKLNRGRPWKWLATEIFPLQRNTNIEISFVENESAITPPPAGAQNDFRDDNPVEEIEEIVENVEIIQDTDAWKRYLYLKTNVPAWAMLWTNIAIEVDLAPHWSFTLPVYYSGFNYFHSDTKFRTLALQPEFRYWPKSENKGFFAGAHFGMGWYNVAFGGDKRYQDHLRRTPAIGGGIAVGYRFNFCRNPHWQMEATIGGGIYKLDYDVFRNHRNGLIIDRCKRTFYGINQAAFTISYRFDISSKKGGEK